MYLNIRLVWKRPAVTNNLAYYSKAYITAGKWFCGAGTQSEGKERGRLKEQWMENKVNSKSLEKVFFETWILKSFKI